MTKFNRHVDGERIAYRTQDGRSYLMVDGYLGNTKTTFLINENDTQSLRLGEKSRVDDAYEVTTPQVSRSTLEVNGRKIPSNFDARLNTITRFFLDSISADAVRISESE